MECLSSLREREAPGGRARENRKFIQAPSPEIWSETISGGEEVLAGKWGGLFLGYLLGKNFRRRDRDQLSFRPEAREASGNETPSSEPGAIVPVSGCLPGLHPRHTCTGRPG